MAAPSETEHRPTWVSRFSLLISRVTMVTIPAIVLAVAYEVVMRYGFSKSTSWVNDLTVWLGAICYLVSGLYAMQRRAHISITMLYDAVPLVVRRVFDVITLIVILTFSFSLILGAGPNAWDALVHWERIGTSWNPPIPGTVKPLILLVIFLIAVQAVTNFIRDYRLRRRRTAETSLTRPEVD